MQSALPDVGEEPIEWGVAVAVRDFTADRRFRSGSNEAFVTGPAELTLAPCPPHPLPVQVTLRFDGFAV